MPSVGYSVGDIVLTTTNWTDASTIGLIVDSEDYTFHNQSGDVIRLDTAYILWLWNSEYKNWTGINEVRMANDLTRIGSIRSVLTDSEWLCWDSGVSTGEMY